MKKLYTFSVFFILSISTFSQIVINEGSNKNYSTIADEDGDYEDWIELYNAGLTTIDLANYYLTDNLSNPTKWVLPTLNMAPGQYEIIYCSKKDRYATPPFTSVVNTGPFVPVVGWNTHTFTTPYFWDGVSNIVVNVCSYSSTGYITNSSFNQSLTPYISTVSTWNDGNDASCSAPTGNTFAQRPNMQLNGMQIGFGTIQNSATDYPAPYGNWYWSARTQMLITAAELTAAGLTAGNINSLAFDVVWTDPVNYDYIDISMGPETATEMTAEFKQSAGTNNHTNFNIDGDGETIYLMTPTLTVMSSLAVNADNYDDSYGCFPDASINKDLFGTPTPGSSNNGSTTYNGYLNAPVLSVNSGFFSTPFSVSITNPNALPSLVFYTLDGSEPTPSSTLYTGTPLMITASGVLRARAFDNDSLPSPIAVATYFFNINHITPILSVTTDNTNLYGSTGIFDNWWMDWLKPAHVEYFDSMSTHPLIFSQTAGIQIDGGAGGSRSQPQHSFRVEWDNGVLGDNPIVHPVIPDRAGRTEFNTFYLRNGSNQYLVLPYKDASQTKMMCKETNAYYSTWRPISVYINGSYFGLYELREKYDAQMFEFQDGADPNTVELLGLSYWYGSVLRATEGDVDNFWNSYNDFLTIDPASPTFWDEADPIFDMEYYADYVIGETWMANVDWPQNNIKIYRSDATDSAWRFCTIDLELGMAPNNWTDCYSDNIDYVLNQSTGNPYINIFLQGVQNDQFRNYFINRYADLMNTSYEASHLLEIEQGIFDQVYPEMANQFFKWGDWWNVPGEMTEFYNNHMIFQSELSCRTNQVRDDIQNNFGLPQQVFTTLDVFPANAGKINISTITPDVYPWTGMYFDGLPIRVEAIHTPGYLFDHWEVDGVISDIYNPVFNDTLFNSSVTFKAYFVDDLSVINASEYSAFMVYPSPASDVIYLVNKTELSASQMTYQVVDINGNILREELFDASVYRQEISVDELSDGIYFIRILGENEISNLRFVKN